MHVAPAGRPVFVETEAPTDAELQALLHRIIARVMKLLTRCGVLVEEARGAAYLADEDADSEEPRVLRHRAKKYQPRALNTFPEALSFKFPGHFW